MFKTIKINAGDGGWGGPLTITPTENCYTVLSVTGGLLQQRSLSSQAAKP